LISARIPDLLFRDIVIGSMVASDMARLTLLPAVRHCYSIASIVSAAAGKR
jgi:hypothetical protein